MHLTDLSLVLSELSEAESPETQTVNRLELEPAMIAGGRKPGLDYKEKKVKGVLDRVTLTLTASNSSKATILAKKYNEIKILSEQLSEMKDLFNLDAKEHMLQYFNAEDEVLTRVIKTVSLTMTLSKRSVANYERTDLEGFYQELLVLLPELEDKLKLLRDKYTKIEKLEKSPSLRVKLPGEKATGDDVEESINEALGDIWGKITALGSRLFTIFKEWGKQYDHKLLELGKRFAIEESLEHREYADNPLPKESLEEVVGEDDQEEPGFKPDHEGMIYELREVKSDLTEAHTDLRYMMRTASVEFNDEDLSALISTAARNTDEAMDAIISSISYLQEKTQVVPVTEKLEDTTDNMVELAKLVRNYSKNPKKNPEVEDRISLILFHKKRPIQQLSLFAILAALQELPADAYQEIIKLVRI